MRRTSNYTRLHNRNNEGLPPDRQYTIANLSGAVDHRYLEAAGTTGFPNVSPTHRGAELAYGVKQSLVYYMALANAHVPSELHIYARGGHAFGLRPTNSPITRWPKLAGAWLRSIGIIGK